jgi:hypothetical protein
MIMSGECGLLKVEKGIIIKHKERRDKTTSESARDSYTINCNTSPPDHPT